MAEELQGLIEKIRRDGVERAEREAAEIVAQAKSKAEAIIREAEARASERMAAAERHATNTTAAGNRTLEQAARDVVMDAGRALIHLFEGMIAKSASSEFSGPVLREGIGQILAAYAKNGMAESRVELLLPPEDQAKLRETLMREFAGLAKGGLEVSAEEGLKAGFKLRLDGGRVTHDFSSEAIAEAIAGFTGPGLAEVVRRATRELAPSKEG